jgi:histidinol-phosphate aminotransferase
MSGPRLTELAQSLPASVPFVGPETMERARGRPFRARIGANESGFGPSPRAIEAMAREAGLMWRYCDPENHDLKTALAAHLGLAPSHVVVGEGIDGLLGLVVRLFAAPGAAVVTSLGAYPTFNYHVAGFGARLVAVPYRDDREDLDALLDAVKTESAPVVYLANPDNPMGSWWPAEEVDRFADALPADTLLVLDEAYSETAPAGALPPIEPVRPNVIRLRTFSKAYGLAGLRCGYAFGDPALIGAFDRVRNHFGVNRMAQQAALAALGDRDHLAHVLARTEEAKRAISAAGASGLAALPSATNFVALDCGDGALAGRLMNALLARDVFVRKPMAPGLDRTVRISAGPAEEMAFFAEMLPLALAEARGG